VQLTSIARRVFESLSRFLSPATVRHFMSHSPARPRIDIAATQDPTAPHLIG